MASEQTPKHFVIVGGSLTSLFIGITLSTLSPAYKITILERTPSSTLQEQGAGIAFSPIVPPVIAAIKKLGIASGAPLLDFFQNPKYERTGTPMSISGDGFLYLKRNGEVGQKIQPPLEVVGSCSWDLLYNVLRANFDGGYDGYVKAAEKVDGVGEKIYRSGVTVTGLNDHGDKVAVLCTDETGKEQRIEADLVIGADGQSSVVRKLLDPESERKYAGYVALRGTVRESLLPSESFKKMLQKNVPLYFGKGTQILTYPIPGLQGNLTRGQRLANAVWYVNATEEEKTKYLTDASGNRHKYSLSLGKIDPDVKASTQDLARQILPECFAEQWCMTERPFVQAITDNLASKAVFMEGKVFLTGDALAGFRPHTTAGTTQGAIHAYFLGKVFGEEKMSLVEYEKTVLGFAGLVSMIGKQMGDLSQFGSHPMAFDKGDLPEGHTI